MKRSAAVLSVILAFALLAVPVPSHGQQSGKENDQDVKPHRRYMRPHWKCQASFPG